MITEEQEIILSRVITQPVDSANLCVHHLFEAQAALTPEAIAAKFEDRQSTYQELNQRANQLARYLRCRGVGPETLCGIYVERSLEMLVGTLGILKAGGAYVPLDPTYPQERLDFMINDTRMPVLLTTQEVMERLPARLPQMLRLDSEWEIIAKQDTNKPEVEMFVDNPAYVIYTSGSTGRPKGVMLPHRSLVNLLSWHSQHQPLACAARTLQFASLSFDVSFQEIFSTLCRGGTLILIPERIRRDARALWQLLINESVERLFLPPVWLQQLAEVAASQDGTPGHLREIITAGEQLRITPQIARLFERLGGCTLHNHYGPSESHVVTAYTLAGPVSGWPILPPIGRAIPNTQTHILDEQLQPVPAGEIGELYIGGAGLARGYLNRAELTAGRFIPDTLSKKAGARLYNTGDQARYLPDGNVEFLGRSDHQIKIRGYRIEPAEIETGLSHHPLVREVVVIARENMSGDKRLIAYLATKKSSVLLGSELRDFLRERLPEHMIPSAFVFLDALPLTPSGKVDRRALPAPDQQRPQLKQAFKAPDSQLEVELKQIWEDLLGIQPIGVRDNFFELGGDSLLAVNLLVKIHEVFGKNLSASILIREATIEYLAGVIASSSEVESWSTVVEINAGGAQTPFFLVHDIGGDVFGFGPLARLIGPDQPFYGLQARGLDGIQEPFTQMEAMAAYYVEEILKLQPDGPYLLGGYSLGGVIAFEMAQQLHGQGRRVAFLAVLDEPAPISNGRRKVSSGAIGNVARNFPHWLRDHVWRRSAAEVFADVQRRLGSIAQKSVRRIFSPFGVKPYEATVAEVMDMVQLPETRRRIMEALYQALMNYSPRVYPGGITLFRTRAQPLLASYGKDKGWGKLAAQGVEVRMVSGNHRNMYEETHAHILAEEMRAALKAIQK
jgi:amino acid adenylation domain-containing protein